jgi:small-conductance mechanosensitive channel
MSKKQFNLPIRKFVLFLLPLILIACAASQDASEAGDKSNLDATLEAAGVIETRSPRATATPGPIVEVVENVAAATNIDTFNFLGLSGADWINLALSLVFVLLGYILGSLAARLLVSYVSKFLVEEASRDLMEKVGRMLLWIIVVFSLHLATIRLTFLNAGLKLILLNIYFVIGAILLTRAVWFIIDIADLELRARLRETGREENLSPALVLAVRLLRVLLVILAMSVILSHFGINMTAFAALLGITGLAFSLAARTTIEDAIAGVIILADQPFRVGDRIEVAAANTWGDVVDIGLRTTRIRTRDNRLVIIPNSLISKNEVINYTYPDPTYRIETHVGLDYDTDIEHARRIMAEAVHEVPNVLKDRPIDVLYSDMGESAMIFRVRWWIETYADTRRVTDEVHTALQAALNKAGIKSPFPTQSIYLHGRPPDDK